MKTNKLVLSAMVINLVIPATGFTAEPVTTVPGRVEVIPAEAPLTPTGLGTEIVTPPSTVEMRPNATTAIPAKRPITIRPSTTTVRGAQVVLRTPISLKKGDWGKLFPLLTIDDHPKFASLRVPIRRVQLANTLLKDAKVRLSKKREECIRQSNGRIPIVKQHVAGCVMSDSIFICIEKFVKACSAGDIRDVHEANLLVMSKIQELKRHLNAQVLGSDE